MAVVIGAAFGAVVTVFVTAFITPLVGVASGAAGDASDRTFELAGVEFPYGVFLQAALRLVIIAVVVYFLVMKAVQRLTDASLIEPEVASRSKQCPECLSSIPEAARRCAFCTVELRAVA